MLSRVPDGIAWPSITIADPSAWVDGCTTWPKLPDASGVERQKVPTVTSAGMPCCARASRSAVGSSCGYFGPLYRISVVLSPGPLVTEHAAGSAGPWLAGEGAPERAGAGPARAGAGPPAVSVMAAAAAAVAVSPDSRRRR